MRIIIYFPCKALQNFFPTPLRVMSTQWMRRRWRKSLEDTILPCWMGWLARCLSYYYFFFVALKCSIRNLFTRMGLPIKYFFFKKERSWKKCISNLSAFYELFYFIFSFSCCCSFLRSFTFNILPSKRKALNQNISWHVHLYYPEIKKIKMSW